MKYDFDQQIAKQVGVEEAIMFSNISWWCAKNKADKSERHYHDGEYWTYSTEQAWSELFPFWTAKQVSRIINNLENAGLLESKQFGGNDRTKWYCPKIEKTEEIPKDQTVSSKRPNGLFQKTKRSTPIYDTDNKPKIITSDTTYVVNESKTKELIVHENRTELELLLQDFKRSRAKLRKPMTDKATELLLRKLSDYSEAEQIAMLEEAIEKGWQTVYPPKQKATTQNQERKQIIANYNFT